MTTFFLVIHLLLAIALVGTVLLQRSEGGALGIGGGGGGMMSGRSAANLLTRVTAALAAAFMATSMLLTIMATNSSRPRSILEDAQAPTAPVEEPAQPAGPTVPAAE